MIATICFIIAAVLVYAGWNGLPGVGDDDGDDG